MAAIKPDVVVLYNLFRYARVRDLLNVLNRNRLVQRALEESGEMWQQLLRSKPMRDLFYRTDELFSRDAAWPTIHGVAVKDVWNRIKKLISTPHSRWQPWGRDFAAMFLFVWTAFPHLYIDADDTLRTDYVLPTFFLANEAYHAQRPMKTADFDWRKFKMAYLHVDFRGNDIDNLTPVVVKADNLAKGPYVWPRILLVNKPVAVSVPYIFGKKPFVRIQQDTQRWFFNAPTMQFERTDEHVENVADCTLAYSSTAGLNLQQNFNALSTSNVLPFIFIVATLRGKFDTGFGYGYTQLLYVENNIYKSRSIPVYYHTEALRKRPTVPGAPRLEAPICLQCGAHATDHVKDAPTLTFCGESCLRKHYNDTID